MVCPSYWHVWVLDNFLRGNNGHLKKGGLRFAFLTMLLSNVEKQQSSALLSRFSFLRTQLVHCNDFFCNYWLSDVLTPSMRQINQWPLLMSQVFGHFAADIMMFSCPICWKHATMRMLMFGRFESLFSNIVSFKYSDHDSVLLFFCASIEATPWCYSPN